MTDNFKTLTNDQLLQVAGGDGGLTEAEKQAIREVTLYVGAAGINQKKESPTPSGSSGFDGGAISGGGTGGGGGGGW